MYIYRPTALLPVHFSRRSLSIFITFVHPLCISIFLPQYCELILLTGSRTRKFISDGSVVIFNSKKLIVNYRFLDLQRRILILRKFLCTINMKFYV